MSSMNKGLPKKYAKMGFKEGWRAYKASKRKRTASVSGKPKKVKGGGHRMAKKSLITQARGLAYIAIPAVQTKFDYDALVAAGRTSSDAIKQAAGRWAGKSPSTGEFSWDVAIQQYTPIATWTVADTLLAKLGVYRKVSRLLPSM